MTVYLSLAQPRIGPIRLHHGWAAVLGALLMLLLLPVPPVEILRPSIEILARPIITIISLMVITILAQRAGLFDWLLGTIMCRAKGDGKQIFFWLFLAGVLTGSILTNDAAVLILTPLVCLMTKNYPGLRPIPYLFAVLNIGNLVAAFVISNPINIVVAEYFGINFLEYVMWMALPAVVAATSTYLILRMRFRQEIADSHIPAAELTPVGEVSPFFAPCLAVIGLTMAGAFLSPLVGIPLWVVTVTGAVTLLVLGRALALIDPASVLRHVAWDVLIFVVGFFIIVSGLKTTGISGLIAELIRSVAGTESSALIYTTGVIAAICSALMNNHPTAYLMALSISDLMASPATEKFLAFAVLIGGDLGPKMLPIGSLAALLWFRILRDHDIHVPYSLYVKVGVPVTLVALLLSLSVLAAEVYLVTNSAW